MPMRAQKPGEQGGHRGTREQANIHTRFMLLLRSMDGWTRRIVRGTARAQARGRERIGHHDDDDDDDVSRLI